MAIKNRLDNSSSIIDINKYFPKITDGVNGELSFNLTNRGVNLYGKIDNNWYQIGNTSLVNPRGKVDKSKSSEIVGRETLINKDTDKFCMFDSGTIKYVTGDTLISYAGAIKFDGSTANGVLTYKDADEATVESNLTFDGSTLLSTGSITVDRNSTATSTATQKALFIDFDQTGISASGQTLTNIGLDLDMNCESVTHVGTVYQTAIDIDLVAATAGTQHNTGINISCTGGDTNTHLMLSHDSTNYCRINTIANGKTTIATADSDGTEADLVLEAGGQIELTAVSPESVKFLNCAAGFLQYTWLYDATNTEIQVRDKGNKAFLTFGSGSITNLKLYLPTCSCNVTLVLKQDGTGSRTVTNWLAFDSALNAANGSSTVLWAGGSAPTLSTGGNAVDILSFYWDATTEICYGVASLNFS